MNQFVSTKCPTEMAVVAAPQARHLRDEVFGFDKDFMKEFVLLKCLAA